MRMERRLVIMIRIIVKDRKRDMENKADFQNPFLTTSERAMKR